MVCKIILKNKTLLLVIAVSLFCFSCTKPQHPALSFCYWKTSFSMDKNEDSLISQLGASHFYIRFFDVDWNAYEKEALPVATIQSSWDFNKGFSITPSIYITNAVMENCDNAALDTLAARIKRRTSSVIAGFRENYSYRVLYALQESAGEKKCNTDSVLSEAAAKFNNKVTEILIDCDWTVKTRDNYFYFLTQIKKQFSQYTISSTLRLWQYKQRKLAGIPKADRCLLMCYSMENPTEYSIDNSIGSVEELSKFKTDEPYPLNLDVAVPIFNWAVMFHEGHFRGLVNNVNPGDYRDDTVNYSPISENRYKLRNNMVIGNKYFRYGDEVRLEQVSPADLDKMVTYIKKNFKTGDNTRITYFSWDTLYIKHYGIEKLKTYCSDYCN
jgi:hypothetical protein